MGFSTSLNRQTSFFDKDTREYLSNKGSLLNSLFDLITDLRHSKEDDGSKKIIVEVKNNSGEVAVLSLVGVNSTSLVSSEMKGSITFTFIKDIDEVNRVEQLSVGPKSMGLRLIKNVGK